MEKENGTSHSQSSRRHRIADEFDLHESSHLNKEPLRLGRRESEPHSAEVSYLHDVLSTNFPQHRAIWDLNHYFILGGEKIDVQFDISFFFELSNSRRTSLI